jgi:hypothetical protein
MEYNSLNLILECHTSLQSPNLSSITKKKKKLPIISRVVAFYHTSLMSSVAIFFSYFSNSYSNFKEPA